uniref:SET domain-containing protein n=1 Tax=Panagrolaimus sp. ES5 TaxID=591445 RepID=A0AC34FC81_9BILA
MKTRGQIRNVEGRKDITDGKEKHPIPVKCPSTIPLPKFQYIKSHSKGRAFYPPADRLPMKGCECVDGKCNSNKCECVKYFAGTKEILECGDKCECDENCGNRKFTNGILPSMFLQFGENSYGFGVFAAENIAKGTFVASYVGEIREVKPFLTVEENDYIYEIASKVSRCDVEIDASKKGNIARFFNHCCKPNLETKIAYFGQDRMPYPVFLAKTNIRKKQEFTIDYGDYYFTNKGIACQCEVCNDSDAD